MTFGARLRAALRAHGPLCVGIDPHERLLIDWGLPVSAAGVREFGLRVVDAAAGRVGVVKPQVAFYERFGSAGFAALEDVLAAARDAGLLVVADAKRGDIGTTMDGYAAAWLDDGSPLAADAVTISPYLGPLSLCETMRQAIDRGRGVFVLTATSNPEAGDLQRAQTAPGPVARYVAEAVQQQRRAFEPDPELASVGFVIGATVDRGSFGLDDDVLAAAPILAPGFGAQGASPADLGGLFGALAGEVVASESRSILTAGPDALAARIDERRALYPAVTRG
ncbi:MAG: orotidine-5'-phosphate decarboxylase [Microbacterium sp.]